MNDTDDPIDDPHADLVGSPVTITLSTGSLISGRLMPRAVVADTALVRVDLGSGGEIMLHPDQVLTVRARDAAPPAEGGGHRLAQSYDTVSAEHQTDGVAVSGAAQVVVGLALGMDIASSDMTYDRGGRGIGTHVPVDGRSDAQITAVFLLAGPLAHARRIGELGYGPGVQAAADVLGGQDARARITDLLQRGYTVWTSQAYRDAEVLLEEAAVWDAVLRVGAALATVGRLTRGDVDVLVPDPGALTGHRIWTP